MVIMEIGSSKGAILMSMIFYLGKEYKEYQRKFLRIKSYFATNAIHYGINPGDTYAMSNSNIFRVMIDEYYKKVKEIDEK